MSVKIEHSDLEIRDLSLLKQVCEKLGYPVVETIKLQQGHKGQYHGKDKNGRDLPSRLPGCGPAMRVPLMVSNYDLKNDEWNQVILIQVEEGYNNVIGIRIQDGVAVWEVGGPNSHSTKYQEIMQNIAVNYESMAVEQALSEQGSYEIVDTQETAEEMQYQYVLTVY